MSTTLAARFAVIYATLRATEEKLAALERVLTKLKERDPRAEHLRGQYLAVHQQRREALAEEEELIEEVRAILKAKTRRLERGRKGEK